MAFAFDPRRQAIPLAAGDKSGVSQARFYKVVRLPSRRVLRLHRLGEMLSASAKPVRQRRVGRSSLAKARRKRVGGKA